MKAHHALDGLWFKWTQPSRMGMSKSGQTNATSETRGWLYHRSIHHATGPEQGNSDPRTLKAENQRLRELKVKEYHIDGIRT